MLSELPDRRRIGKEIHMQNLPAAAGARHCGCPGSAGIFDHIEGPRREVVRFVIDAFDLEGFILKRLSPGPGPKSRP
jgi:hypothetical protein